MALGRTLVHILVAAIIKYLTYRLRRQWTNEIDDDIVRSWNQHLQFSVMEERSLLVSLCCFTLLLENRSVEY